MKKLFIIIIIIAVFAAGAWYLTNNKKNEQMNTSQSTETTNTNTAEKVNTNTSEKSITKDMAYEGVNNYCHSNYDWSIAEENPSMMYLTMGDETEVEYKVIFRNYTGVLVYFYVDKSSGATKMTEYVPALDIESEAGEFDLFDYLNKND